MAKSTGKTGMAREKYEPKSLSKGGKKGGLITTPMSKNLGKC